MHYPVKGASVGPDLRTSSAGHAGTDILAPCSAGVYASHPGIVQVKTGGHWGNYVRVRSNNGGLVTSYAYLSRVLVKNGQIMQSGQALGIRRAQARG